MNVEHKGGTASIIKGAMSRVFNELGDAAKAAKKRFPESGAAELLRDIRGKFNTRRKTIDIKSATLRKAQGEYDI